MAKFKLSLLNLTDNQQGENNIIVFSPSVISEFYSPDVVENNRLYNQQQGVSEEENWKLISKYQNYCHTYDENFSKHSNAQKELSFKMDKMILKDDEWIENPYARLMLPGVQLCLQDNYDNQYLFTVVSVKYNFKETNITYEITCQDSFSQQSMSQNDGYEIVNDISRSDFIGAKDIDFWAKKIANDCYIPYFYLPLSQGLYLCERNGIKVVTVSCLSSDKILKIIKEPYYQKDHLEYYDLIPFSGSGNANSILIELGNQIDFMLNTCEYSSDDNQFQRYFWFEPKKHELTSGLMYSPYSSIKSFDLTHNGKSLTTILNVSGNKTNNKIISLLPSVPSFFLQLFNSLDWDNLNYSPKMYSNLVNQKTQHYDTLNIEDLRIWHRYAKDGDYIESFKNVSVGQWPYSGWETDIENYDSNNIYYKSPYIYLPIATNDQNNFTIPGYDDYNFTSAESNSFIKYTQNNTEKYFDARQHKFELVYTHNYTDPNRYVNISLQNDFDWTKLTSHYNLFYDTIPMHIENSSTLATLNVLGDWSTADVQGRTELIYPTYGKLKILNPKSLSDLYFFGGDLQINDLTCPSLYFVDVDYFYIDFGTTDIQTRIVVGWNPRFWVYGLVPCIIHIKKHSSEIESYSFNAICRGSGGTQTVARQIYEANLISGNSIAKIWDTSWISFRINIPGISYLYTADEHSGSWNETDPISILAADIVGNDHEFFDLCAIPASADQHVSIWKDDILSVDTLSQFKYSEIDTITEGENAGRMYLRILDTTFNPQNPITILNEELNLKWMRTPTAEEKEFAEIADEIPWLENKLIDFSYYSERNIINKSQFVSLNNSILNDLRKINGKLIFYTNAYYSSLHYQTTKMADLLNSLEGLSAIFNANIITPLQTKGAVANIQQFENSYNCIFNTTVFDKKEELLNYDTVYSDYVNKYFYAQQRFLKNVYLFKQYFNENVSFFSSDSQIYKDTITIMNEPVQGNKNKFYYYSFQSSNQNFTPITSSFQYYDNNYTPIFNIYQKDDNKNYGLVEIVDATNYTNYNYATIEAAENYTESLGNFENQQYYQKIYKISGNLEDDIQLVVLDSNTDISFDVVDVLQQIENKTRRLWRTIKKDSDTYVYANMTQEINGTRVLYLYSDLVRYKNESVAQFLSHSTSYSISTFSLTNYRPIQFVDMQQNYYNLLSFKQSELTKFYGETSATEEVYTPNVSWYSRKQNIYTSAANLFWKDSGIWTTSVQKNSDGDDIDIYTFNCPWTWSCFSTFKDFNNLMLPSLESLLPIYIPLIYSSNLPIDSLYIYTHKYKEQQGHLYVVNKKNQSYQEWINSLSETLTPAEIVSHQDNPYNYLDYISIPFVNVKNYEKYAYRRFYENSWMSHNNNDSVSSIANLGVFLTTDGNVVKDISISDIVKNNPNTFCDNAAYGNSTYYDTNKYDPGKTIYLSNLTSSLVSPNNQIVQSTSYDWCNNSITYLKSAESLLIQPEDFNSLDNCFINSMSYSNQKFNCSLIKPYSYVSFYKYMHHTFGTLLHTVFKNFSRNDFQSISLQGDEDNGDILYFKDTRLVLLSPTDILSTTDKVYFLPFFNEYYAECESTDFWNDLKRAWKGKKNNHGTDAFIDMTIAAQSGDVAKDTIGTILNKIKFSYVFNDITYNYISKISCYPWMECAQLLVPTIDYNTTERLLRHSFDTYSINTDLGNYYYKVTSSNHTYYGIMVKEEGYSKEVIDYNNYNFNVYDSRTNNLVQWTNLTDISKGFYIHNDQDSGFKSASELESFNPNLHYYNVHNDRIFTIKQIISKSGYYYFANNIYEETNWNPNKLQFDVSIYKYEIDFENNTIKNMKQIGDAFNLTVKVPSLASKTQGYTIAPFDNQQTRITIQGHSEKELANLTNGQFWYEYHDSTEYPTLFEYSAAIETKLQEYWSVAYNASLFCEYFIPQSWQPSVNGVKNFFADKLFTFTNNQIKLSGLLPTVSIININNSVNFPQYQFHYHTTFNENNSYKTTEVIEKFPWYSSLKDKFGNDFWDGFTVEENGNCNYYQAEGGIIKSSIFQDLQIGSPVFNQFDGIYSMIITILRRDFMDKPLNEYEYYYNAHNAIWKKLYTLYPSVLMENKYENTTATTSKELLTMAKYAFKDLSHPERGYNISMINNLKDFINYQGQELKIGDPIQLASNEFYDQFDDIRTSLDQLLFITDIKYNLREDNNISITVNSIKYQDKLIQRLVKLIK